MVKQEVSITNKVGLHARPANTFVKTAARYKSNVMFRKDGRTFNGKSIVSIVSACVKCGATIEVICEGEDEREALEEIVAAVESGLGE